MEKVQRLDESGSEDSDSSSEASSSEGPDSDEESGTDAFHRGRCVVPNKLAGDGLEQERAQVCRALVRVVSVR